MAALSSLKRLLQESNITLKDEDESFEVPDNLSHIEKYLSSEREGHYFETFEKIRVDHSREEIGDPELKLLTDADIDTLSRRFETYGERIRAHIEKLKPIEKVITKYDKEIESLSSSLSALKDESLKLSTDFNLQSKASESLNPIILDLMIPPDVITSVNNGPINEKWIENIKFVSEKRLLIRNVESNWEKNKMFKLYKESEAFSTLKTGVELLASRCVERIRNFMISNIKSLRSSQKQSSQVLQNKLLLVKDIYVFLKSEHPELAEELQLAYIYTMRWYYYSRFAKYAYALQKIRTRDIDLSYVLGSVNSTDEKNSISSGLKSWIYSSNTDAPPSTATNSQSTHLKISYPEYLLSVEKRINALLKNDQKDENGAIPSQIAETTPFHYWLEFIFKQWRVAIVDNIVVEYFFMVDFFYEGDERFPNLSQVIKRCSQTPVRDTEDMDWPKLMFSDVFDLSYEFVNWLISHTPLSLTSVARANAGYGSFSKSRMNLSASFHGTCDCYAILMMIRLVQKYQFLLHNEIKVPILDNHLNSLLMLLWPQFTRIIDLNCDSMKTLVLRPGSLKSFGVNLAPTPLTQNFAHFLLGLLKLSFLEHTNSDNESPVNRGEPIFTSINRLTNDFENVLTKMSHHYFGSGAKKGTEKEIFLFNNYFLIVNILRDENMDANNKNEFINENIAHFEALCNAYKKG